MDRQELQKFLLKCQDALTHFKKKRKDVFVQYGDTQYDSHIKRLLSLTHRVEDELRGIDAVEDNKTINSLFTEYETIGKDTRQELIESLQKEFENIDKEIWYSENFDNWVKLSLQREFENIDKEIWYSENFDNWVKLPERQECESYPIAQRLRYSKCRHVMFDHIEKEWKKKTFPTLHNRLEFF